MPEETIGPADDAPAYAPDPFDPAKRGSSYRDLWQAATEMAVEDATAVAALLRDRDATIATLTAALEEARGALEAFQKLHDEIMLLAEEAFREGDMDCADPSAWAKSCDWDDLRRASTVIATIKAALGRIEG